MGQWQFLRECMPGHSLPPFQSESLVSCPQTDWSVNGLLYSCVRSNNTLTLVCPFCCLPTVQKYVTSRNYNKNINHIFTAPVPYMSDNRNANLIRLLTRRSLAVGRRSCIKINRICNYIGNAYFIGLFMDSL
jgi:hypothetical protein